MARLRRWLILTHRYLGIALGVLVVVWFASGVAMIYAGGMPALEEGERLERLDPLDVGAVRRTPGEAGRGAGVVGEIERVTLRMLEGRPVYRIGSGGRSTVVFADTGERLEPVGPERARRIGARFAGVDPGRVRHERRLLRADQWTIAERGRLPLHRLAVEDGEGSRVYVSERTGEVVQWTTRGSRALAWVAAIPHWLYVAPLRLRAGLWRQVILWTSGLACVLAGLGLVLAVVQLRISRPLRLSRLGSLVPYRGWLRWHYLTGAVFGLFALTWLFSGLLSMEPWGWAAGGGLPAESVRAELAGDPLSPADFPPIDGDRWSDAEVGSIGGAGSIKEVEYRRILDEPYFVIRRAPAPGASSEGGARSGGRAGTAGEPGGGSYGSGSSVGADELLVHAETLEPRTRPFPDDALLDRVRRAYPEVDLVEARRLEGYDAYHYGRDGAEPLPVLRVKMDDPDRTWFYLDPAVAALSTRVDRLDRVERWLYHGFHSLDFAFWYDRRPLWDAGVILLLLGGLAASGIGIFLGFRRLWRKRPGGG